MMFYTYCLLFSVLAITVLYSKAERSPNIILFVIDDLGWNDTSYQGSDIHTPNIDKLASEGIRLKQYYVQPLCSPSRSALLTGKYPYHLGLAHGVITNGHPYGLNLKEKTIANYLQTAGYSTHAIGKWDLGMHKWEYTPTYRGFDTFYGYYDADEDYWTHKVGGYLDFRNNTLPVRNETNVYSTHLFTNAIQDAISYTDNKPFFIYGAYQSVHGPLEAPQQYIDQCNNMPTNNRKIFCGMLKALDEGIGNITTLLQTKGILDNTIIILTTDNGGQTALGSSNWPLRGNKATVFEGGVRGVSFVRNGIHSYDNYELIHITDWYKTIIEGIVGIHIADDTIDGYNMWDTIINNKKSPRNEILLQLDPPRYDNPHNPFIGQAAIRYNNWKLIIGLPNCSQHWVPTGNKCPNGWIHINGSIELPQVNNKLTWLFNITNDPNERDDLSIQYPDIVNMLKQRIEIYNSTHITQLSPPYDPNCNPAKFNNVWTPWIK